MQVDHIIPYRNIKHKKNTAEEIEDISNLNPSCRMCNYYKRARGLESMRRDIKRLNKQLERSFDYRLAKRYGLINEIDKPIVFYYEQY